MAGLNVLVVGANRGIGLGLLKVFKEHGYNVFGTIRPQTRSDPSFKDLEATGATIYDVDYLDEDSIAAAAKSYGSDKALDVLVNCGGIEVHPESWLETSADLMTWKYRVMTVGPLLTSQHFLPNLKRSNFGKIVQITSRWASIQADDTGGHCSYRACKSALNSMSIAIALELKRAKENIGVLCIEPGDVPTKLSRWAGDVSIEDSSKGMFAQIEKFQMKDTGTFISYSGKTWPW